MSKHMMTGRSLHPWAKTFVADFKAGKLDRREFLASMAGVGVTAAGAMALGGIATTPASAADPQKGGTMRISMQVKAFKDPRTFDWTEMGAALASVNEYLVRRQRLPSFPAATARR